jgi:hypothetical protein
MKHLITAQNAPQILSSRNFQIKLISLSVVHILLLMLTQIAWLWLPLILIALSAEKATPRVMREYVTNFNNLFAKVLILF